MIVWPIGTVSEHAMAEEGRIPYAKVEVLLGIVGEKDGGHVLRLCEVSSKAAGVVKQTRVQGAYITMV